MRKVDGRYLELVTGEITVFSGSSHPDFVEELCQILGVALAPARTMRFSNDCLQVQLRANCRQRDVYVVQSLVPPVQESLVELLLMLDAARGASAAHITAVIPHFAYARSDKKDAPRLDRRAVGRGLLATLVPGSHHGAARRRCMGSSVPVDHSAPSRC
jgi:ribose-phosphate pyrophosphokinase